MRSLVRATRLLSRTVPAVTINDYAGSITTQELTTAKVELLIDKAKYYSFKVDDVLAAQADINLLEAASSDAAEGMRVAVETAVLSSVVTGATTIGSQTTITASNILTSILDQAKALDELNIQKKVDSSSCLLSLFLCSSKASCVRLT